jgi:hypothetical protein
MGLNQDELLALLDYLIEARAERATADDLDACTDADGWVRDSR